VLSYSADEYDTQVWYNSARVKKVDTQLHSVMRMISDTVKSTHLQWLPILNNIVTPNFRKTEKLIKTIKKAEDRKNLLLIERLEDVPTFKLISRKPL